MITGLSGLLHVAPYASMVNDLVQSITRDYKGSTTVSEAEKPEKYGIFSKKDEALVAKLILGLSDAADSENIVGFYSRMYNAQIKKGAPITFQHFIESVMFRNDHFSHLAILADKSAPKKKGVERTVTKGKFEGKDQTTTVETDIMSDAGGPSAAQKFLVQLAKRISDEITSVAASFPNATNEAQRKRAYERVYKKYYKGDFTSRIRMVGEDDTRIWERFGLTKENWDQFSKWATPIANRAIALADQAYKDGGRELGLFLESEAQKNREDNRITPEVWTWDEAGRKLWHIPRNLFYKLWDVLMPF